MIVGSTAAARTSEHGGRRLPPAWRTPEEPETHEGDGTTSAHQAGQGGGNCLGITQWRPCPPPLDMCVLPDSYPKRKRLWTGSLEAGTPEGSEPPP